MKVFMYDLLHKNIIYLTCYITFPDYISARKINWQRLLKASFVNL